MGDPGLAVDPSVGSDAALLFRPHPGQVDRGVLLHSRRRKLVDIDGNPAGIERVQSMLLIREVLHDQAEDDLDRNARAEQRDRADDDAPHPDRVGLVAASRPANAPLGKYVFHCRQPPALGGAGETPAPPWSQLSLPKSSGVLDHLVQVRVVERDQRPALQVPDEERRAEAADPEHRHQGERQLDPGDSRAGRVG